MFLTDLQKQIAKDIGVGKIRFVNDFIKIYFDTYNEEEKKEKLKSIIEFIQMKQLVTKNFMKIIFVRMSKINMIHARKLNHFMY